MINEYLEKIKKKDKEKGCTEPLYGHKAKCVMSIVPQTTDIPSFQIDNKCVKYKINPRDAGSSANEK